MMIRTVLLDLPCSVKGFVRENDTGEYVCVLNAKLSHEMNLETIRHELAHIINDDLKKQCAVGELELIRHKQY